jgi:hypothetical protein
MVSAEAAEKVISQSWFGSWMERTTPLGRVAARRKEVDSDSDWCHKMITTALLLRQLNDWGERLHFYQNTSRRLLYAYNMVATVTSTRGFVKRKGVSNRIESILILSDTHDNHAFQKTNYFCIVFRNLATHTSAMTVL